MLEIKNLSIKLAGLETKDILKNVSVSVPEQSIVALVGGSGSGKTTTGLAILQLLAPELKITGGQIVLKGQNLLTESQEQIRKVRGKEIGMIFQEPLNAFNPVFTIGSQIEEVLLCHTTLNPAQREKRILELLDVVGIFEPERVSKSYPHQLSGGMRQRAMTAQAIAGGPKLIIADEPTSSLDVTLQARVIELFQKLKKELRVSFLLITHDLGVVQHTADKVYVLRRGEVVESGLTQDVLAQPKHDYTKQLMEALIV